MQKERRSSDAFVKLQPMTPGALAEGLGAHFLDVIRILVSQGHYVSSDQRVDLPILLAFGKQADLTVRDSFMCCPAPPKVAVKPRWLRFQLGIKKRSLRRLYHFTPLSNLPGILSCGGLLCRRQLDARGIASSRRSWGSLEKERLLGSDYICLSITNQWSMLSREMLQSAYPPAILVVKPRVIWYTETCFCPTNSANGSIGAKNLLNWTEIDHFDELFSGDEDDWPTDSQAEVLVRDCIELEDIKEVFFYDSTAYEHALALCGTERQAGLGIRVRISEKPYPDELSK